MPSDKKEETGVIYSKGTELDILAKNLVECAFDENEDTRDIMLNSMISLGTKEPKLVLSLILVFLKGSIKNKKVPVGHRVLLLSAMKDILKVKHDEIADIPEFAADLIKQVIEEMTFTKDIVPDWQSAASEVLMNLSSNYCQLIMTALSDKLQPSVMPHFFVIQTLGAMANNNPYEMVPYLTGIITQMLTLLSLAKADNIRWVIANTFSQFSESILEYIANKNDRTVADPNITLQSFSGYILTAFEIFYTQWINTKESKLRKAVMDAIGFMVFIIERSSFENHLSRLLTVILNQYKKHQESYHITKTLSMIIQAAANTNNNVISNMGNGDGNHNIPNESGSPAETPDIASERPLIIECAVLTAQFDNLVNVLFQQLQQSLATLPSSASAQQQVNQIRNQNEAKRGLTSLCVAYPDKVLSFFLQRFGVAGSMQQHSSNLNLLTGANEKTGVAALIVLRHLITSCNLQMKERKTQLIAGIKQLIGHSSEGSHLSNNMKMQLAHCIIAMGGQGYLVETGGLFLIEFIVRQCALASKQDASKLRRLVGSNTPPDQSTNEQLRAFCRNVLHLGSSTVKSMRTVLWPFVMEMIVPVPFTDAVGTICNAINNLLSNSADDDSISDGLSEEEQNPDRDIGDLIDGIIDYDVSVNIPGPQYLMARLIVLAGVPRKDNRGISILKAMQVLVINFHESLPEIWNLIIPKLIHYLERTTGQMLDEEEDYSQKESDKKQFDQLQWEELMLKMIAKSIEHINDEEWTCELGEAMGQHISLYEHYPAEKGFLFKCLGTIIANTTLKTFIDRHLDLIFQTARLQDTDERTGFAVSFGISSARHLDTVLTKLDTLFRHDTSKKTQSSSGGGGGFMRLLMKDKSHNNSAGNSSDNAIVIVADKDVVKCSILLAFTNAMYYGPVDLVTSRLESYVIKVLYECINTKSIHKHAICIRLIIDSIDLISRSIYIKKLGHPYKLECRNDLIGCLVGYIEAEPMISVHSDVRAVAMATISNLIKLPPAITDVEMHDLVNKCMENIISLPPDGISVKKSKETAYDEAQHLVELMAQTTESLNHLCISILKTYYSNITLNELYNVIRDRLTHDHDHVRERALIMLKLILDCYYQELTETNTSGNPLTSIGTIVGDIIPRLADSEFVNRQLTVDCVELVLKIQMKLDLGRDPSDDPCFLAIPSIKERLKKFDSNIVFGAVNELAKSIARRIDTRSLDLLLTSLYKGLEDKQKHGCSAVCVMIHALFRLRYADLVNQVPYILTTLHDILPNLVDNTRTGVLHATKLLSSNYLIETLNVAMSQPLPLDQVWTDILCASSNDETLLDKSLVHLVELLSRAMPFEEREDPTKRKVKGEPQKYVRYSCHVWLAALNCLQIMLSSEISCGKVCIDKIYSRLLVSLLLACGSTVHCSPFTGAKSLEKKSGLEANLTVGVHPVKIAKDALKNFMVTSESHFILEDFNVQNGWDKLENEAEFMEFIELFTKSVCQNKISEMPLIINQLNLSINSNYEQHRILITGFYGASIDGISMATTTSNTTANPTTVSNHELECLLDTIIQQLVGRLGDKVLEVRRLSLVGIGRVSKCSETIITRHATSLLSALLMGMDDRQDTEDKLINASMVGLTGLLGSSSLKEQDVREVLVTLCLRMLSSYERESSGVRAAAFKLFGALSRLAVVPPSRARYLTEMDSVIVPLLVHLEDPCYDVVRACKHTIKQIMPLYTSLDNIPSEMQGASMIAQSPSTNKLNEFIQSCLREDGFLHYGEFCNEMSKLLVVQMPHKVNELIMRCLIYFKSEYPELAASSVLLIGFLMRNLSSKLKEELQKGQICIELIQLLHSKHPKVRGRAAETISLLDLY